MQNANITFKFVTPCIMAGANQQSAEMRIPALRGQLRWWHRNMGYPAENKIFGGTDVTIEKKKMPWKSSLIIRELSEAPPFKLLDAVGISGNRSDYFLWPLRQTRRGVIDAGVNVSIVLSTRHGGYQTFDSVLKAFLLLGSLGTRSRRCYGSIWPVKVEIDKETWSFPNTEREFIEHLNEIFDDDAKCRIIKIARPERDWKTAIRSCANFLKSFRCGSHKAGGTPSPWGQNDHDVIKGERTVYRQAIGLPLEQKYSNNGTLTSNVKQIDRLASPVLLKIIPIENNFLPIGIVFPENSLDADTEVLLKGSKGASDRRATVDLELLKTISDPACQAHRTVWRDSSIMADFM